LTGSTEPIGRRGEALLKNLSRMLLISLIGISLHGCSSLRFYSQATSGQLRLLWNREPVAEVIADPQTPPELATKLSLAVEVREFAQQELALPVGGSFSDYVHLDRPWVVVNLLVAPEFSLELKQWCYPIVGCQSYRGYFDIELAREEQRYYESLGRDTYLAPVAAFSTLGWFDDPLHRGFTDRSPTSMVALMIHELTHQRLYMAGDTTFNESFATAVELEGLRLWLEQNGDPEAFVQVLEQQAREEKVIALVREYSERLNSLYRQHPIQTEAEIRSEKQNILNDLETAYGALSASWGGSRPLASEDRPLNNARLALFAQYRRYVPAFRQMLSDYDYDFAAFYEAVEALSELPAGERQARLDQYAEEAAKNAAPELESASR